MLLVRVHEHRDVVVPAAGERVVHEQARYGLGRDAVAGGAAATISAVQTTDPSFVVAPLVVFHVVGATAPEIPPVVHTKATPGLLGLTIMSPVGPVPSELR